MRSVNRNLFLVSEQTQNAIEYFHNRYGCILFFLTFLNENNITNETHPKDHALSTILDEIIHQYNIIIVTPSGNSLIFQDRDEAMQMRTDLYPALLFDENNRIYDGATSCSALTIGSYAGFDSSFPSIPLENNQFLLNQARFLIPINQNDPSNFSRVGPGFNGNIKPEILARGGNEAFDAEGLVVRGIEPLCELSLDFDVINRNYFSFTNGTCISAAKVAWALSILIQQYPGHTGNFYRALIVNRVAPTNFSEFFTERHNNLTVEDTIIRFSYGKLCNRLDLLYGEPYRITLFHEDQIGYDDLHYYEIPIPDSFRTQSGTRSIIVTLAFNPPVRASRQDYTGIDMRFFLIRTIDPIESVRDFFRLLSEHDDQQQNDNHPNDGIPHSYSDLAGAHPTISNRSSSTVQYAKYSKRRIPAGYQDAHYYIVIRCHRKPWFSPDQNESSQHYTLVVTIEQDTNNQLYNQIDVQIHERVLL